MRRQPFRLVCMLVIAAIGCEAQQPSAATESSALPAIHFVFDHPELYVSHYEMDIDANGKAHYESHIRGQEKGSTEPSVTKDFVVSSATRERLFALIKEANNLDGNFDFTKHRIAFTGTKTITLTDRAGTHTTKLVWSENQHVMDLVDTLQGISGTLEEEPILLRLRRFDRLGLNAELGKMEKMAASGGLREINLISGILKEIANDQTIMSPARKRAERLLKLASPAGNES